MTLTTMPYNRVTSQLIEGDLALVERWREDPDTVVTVNLEKCDPGAAPAPEGRQNG